MNKHLRSYALAALTLLVGSAAMADETTTVTPIAIPTATGEYITTSNSTAVNLNEDDGGGLGSAKDGSSATFTLHADEALSDMYLTFRTATQTAETNKPTVTVEMTGSDYTYTKKVDIPCTNNWTFSTGTLHLLSLGSLPAGDITLKFTFNVTGTTYAGNLGNIAVYSPEGLASIYTLQPDNYIPLDKGSYSNKYCPEYNKDFENAYNIGYLSNGAWNQFNFFATAEGRYNLCMRMKYSSGGTMNVSICDAITGTVEVNQDIEVTEELAKGKGIQDDKYGTEVPMLLNAPLTKGPKTLKLSFTTSGSWFMNYIDLRLTKADYDLTVGDAKYATLVLPFDCELPTGVKAYTLTGVDEANYVNCKEVTGTLAKNTPVLVSAEKGTYRFVATAAPDAADAPASGLLTGVWEETAVPTGAYVLQNKNENVAFYKVSATDYKIKANRAYLSLPSNAKTLMLNFDGETTGIGSIVPSFNNAADAPCYNLNGVRVNSSAPGLIIKNGKKFINK